MVSAADGDGAAGENFSPIIHGDNGAARNNEVNRLRQSIRCSHEFSVKRLSVQLSAFS